jgi:hypothetical protein
MLDVTRSNVQGGGRNVSEDIINFRWEVETCVTLDRGPFAWFHTSTSNLNRLAPKYGPYKLLYYLYIYIYNYLCIYVLLSSGRAAEGAGLRSLARRDCGFDYRREHGCLFVMRVECRQLEVSATGWSLVQRIPTECCVSTWVWSWCLYNERRLWPSRGYCAV